MNLENVTRTLRKRTPQQRCLLLARVGLGLSLLRRPRRRRLALSLRWQSRLVWAEVGRGGAGPGRFYVGRKRRVLVCKRK